MLIPARVHDHPSHFVSHDIDSAEPRALADRPDARVLDLAADPDEPLLERVKFCGIVSSILDEFFMVRVAGLHDQVVTGLAVRRATAAPRSRRLPRSVRAALDLTAEQTTLWRDELCPALAPRASESARSTTQRRASRTSSSSSSCATSFPVLTPLAVGPGQPFPYISGLSLSLGLLVRDPEAGEERFARVKVPEGLDRFVGDR